MLNPRSLVAIGIVCAMINFACAWWNMAEGRPILAFISLAVAAINVYVAAYLVERGE